MTFGTKILVVKYSGEGLGFHALQGGVFGIVEGRGGVFLCSVLLM